MSSGWTMSRRRVGSVMKPTRVDSENPEDERRKHHPDTEPVAPPTGNRWPEQAGNVQVMNEANAFRRGLPWS